MSTTVETSVMLDTNSETQLRINFNITLMDLSCDYAAIDVVDVLGTNSMNVTSNIEKWQLDENGVRMIFQGRNREQKSISHDEHHPDIEVRHPRPERRFQLISPRANRRDAAQALHENGVHAIPLSQDNFDTFLEENPYVFVNFVRVLRTPSRAARGIWGGVGERGGAVAETCRRAPPSERARASPFVRERVRARRHQRPRLWRKSLWPKAPAEKRPRAPNSTRRGASGASGLSRRGRCSRRKLKSTRTMPRTRPRWTSSKSIASPTESSAPSSGFRRSQRCGSSKTSSSTGLTTRTTERPPR